MQDWIYPYEVQKVVLSDTLELAYIDEGQGEYSLLFLHGLGSYLKAWQQNIDGLSQQFRCIALDLPGYGKSSQDDYAYDMKFFAQSVRAFIDSLALEKVILVGHSMGGQVAVHSLLMDDSRIEKLVLIAPAGFETFSKSEKQWFQSLVTPETVKATPEAQIIRNFEINFHQMPKEARFMIDDRLAMRETPAYDHYCAMIPKCVSGMLEQTVFDRLPEIKQPTLIIFGQNDLLIPNPFLHPNLTTESVARAGQRQIPGSQLMLLPNAGHFVQWEQADRVNQLIMKFLQ
ncbi:MAG: alpha/beta hydrolase [Saprospiraceae bacterium]|nr:MAG: alpha/beta hydrolase [Saprospiraceae bacterium]